MVAWAIALAGVMIALLAGALCYEARHPTESGIVVVP